MQWSTPAHAPAVHTSATVLGLPSSHGVPSTPTTPRPAARTTLPYRQNCPFRCVRFFSRFGLRYPIPYTYVPFTYARSSLVPAGSLNATARPANYRSGGHRHLSNRHHSFWLALPFVAGHHEGLFSGRQNSALVVVDEGLVAALPALPALIARYFAVHDPPLRLVCPPLVQPGGEQSKGSWGNVSEIHRAIDLYQLDRHSYVIAVGGGALLDLVGLAAATAHRGVRHVRIPTTTLSQCDSGVGVKNGINAFGKKNFIGTFAPPFAVINDFRLLATLSHHVEYDT